MTSRKDSNKIVYKLEEVSRIAQLDPKTIDTWEKEFYFLHAGQTASGKKIFRKKDLTIIIRLKELIENQGFTLAGARRKIEEEFALKPSTPMHPDRMKKLIFHLRDQLKEILSSLEKEEKP